ncbi:16S rRNA (uracil(1498)-N(3))-methyltransferase [Allobranchiibius sp. GilTou73]|uniref:16S rRNA (uracil(1498)-N(3))-methyltransferase n=1 Tax=Allobranchiibius sp. GilTou73 TaxID=2904523 RepID=UPI001F271F99|nr:16S rRNA (uracil(1498)-N(3))-methyltransferase [Allobranchiibius sp. GilTou73]UIJ34359.1 16S rRNA (uracil(1498)-N(3))-methyltransferase [Allobranchiibius sp. GilTou73]
MTAPMFYAEPGSLAQASAGAVITLTGPEGRHAVRVRRMVPGEPVQLSDGSGVVAVGRVDAAEDDMLAVLIDALERPDSCGPRFVLVQALAKGGRDELAIEAATELGVDAVVPWAAERCVVQWRGDRAVRSHRKWESVVSAAAKQARRAMLPVVEPLATSAQLADRLAGARVVLLHEEATSAIGALDLDGLGDGDRVALVVGPEGGVSDQERASLVAAGADVVRLGPSVLRSSTAGPAALAVLSARLRW